MLELQCTNLEGKTSLREKEDEERMKTCELCNSPARMYCNSDQASLCWNCDSKVHGTNFLVARHSRSLLCHVCQCPTPWSLSGTDFGPTVSVCRRCASKGAEKNRRRIPARDEIESGNDAESDSQEVDGDEEEEEMSNSDDGDGEIQVVPARSSTPPPPATSSCSGDEYSSRKISVASDGESPVPTLKRVRESSSDLLFQEDLDRRSKRKDVAVAVFDSH